jgi:hypothetical protein
MKTMLKNVEIGKTVFYGGREVLVLDHQNGKTLVLCKESIGDMPFDTDNCNDWKKSSLRKYLNGEFLNSLIKTSDMEREIEVAEVDLTADDGLTDYGTSNDKIFLLTCDQYRKYRKLIPNLDDWWWLATPYSTASNGYAHYVRNVNSDGGLNNSFAYYGRYGVRPAWFLKSDILVSDEEEESGCACIVSERTLESYSTRQLLEELIRREGLEKHEDEEEE